MKIKIIDDLNPEDVAMVQALYSRSAASVDDHLAKAKASGSERLWQNFVVGYGHRSIADCGSTTLFIEGVSLLAAKAIQDSPMYSGQETSTRYIDMAKQAIVIPTKEFADGVAIMERWMDFYTRNQTRVAETVRKRHPIKPEEATDPKKTEAYDRAVKARVFDILRGFLPAGITTQLSWHTNLRQAADHLLHLSNHPSEEIREIARQCRAALAARYPSSGFDLDLATVSGVANKGKTPEEIKKAEQEAESRREWEANAGKLAYGKGTREPGFGCMVLPQRPVPYNGPGQDPEWDLLQTRPRGCVIPHYFTAAGLLSWQFPLDFGSFRDLQRHRNGVCRMPLLTTELGFESWYIDQLDEELQNEALNLIATQYQAIRRVSEDPVIRQYYTALGFRVGCEIAYALPAAVYIMEMRSARTVHPTLRKVVLEQMVPKFRAWFPDMALHVDEEKDDWTIRRGHQTITEKT
jgi:thymidylate synthase ThyX